MASGVVVVCVALLATRWTWLVVPLAYGFVARVASGPRFSPLGLLATRVVVPALPIGEKLVPGPPKRFAQAIGAVLSVSALVAFALGSSGLGFVLVAMITVAATAEAALGFCLGCKVFALLMRLGVVPASVCAECADISGRLAARASATTRTAPVSSSS